MMDTSVTAMTSEVDAVVWQALGSRAGSEAVTMPR
jgi:hypothetical protein